MAAMRGTSRALRAIRINRGAPVFGSAPPPATAPRWSAVPTPERRSGMSTLIPPGKTLGEVTHVDLLEKENADVVVKIWREYHEGKSGKTGAIVEPRVYDALSDRSKVCPMFVMPLHKSMSQYLTLVVQSKMPYVSFTAIEDFRKLQDAATPMLVASHYPELAASKGLALVQAVHVDKTTAGAAEHLTTQEAVRLVRLCHTFYAEDDLYEKFVKPFNHNQKDFDFDAMVLKVRDLTWSDEHLNAGWGQDAK